MLFRYASAIVLTACFSLSAAAHDFWLAPDTYVPKDTQNVNMAVMVGHPADQSMWPVSYHRIIALRSVGPNGVQDHQAAIAHYPKSQTLPLTFDAPGLHVVTMETTAAISKLNAKKFNAYLEEEGLTPIRLDRIAKGTTEEPGTETYSRRGKSLIQVGPRDAIDPEYLSRPTGLTLEIVPEKHPARVKIGEMMTSQIFYRGKPTRGVTIGLIDLETDKGLIDIGQSDPNGRVSFARPETGNWMLHAVWSSPLEGHSIADYDTIFSSLSFSVE